jgi:HEPN domain-containing protein
MRGSPSDEGLRWLEQAREDLHWAGDLAERGGYHIACFLAQQVGEKALKGFIYAQGEEIVIGHSVERLCHYAARWEPRFRELVKRWAILDGFYVATRYPNSIPGSIPARVYTRDAASEAVSLASEIVDLVEELLDRG